MKTAIYIEDGVVQLVLTPTSKFEKDALQPFMGEDLTVKTFVGSFYDCRGGWIRQQQYYHQAEFSTESKDRSIMIRINEKKEKPVEVEEFCNLKVVEVSQTIMTTNHGVWPEKIDVSNIEDPTKTTVATYKLIEK